MPQRRERLKETVQELEQELESLESLDADTRATLETAARDIHAALHADDPAELESQDFSERLRQAAADFENSHPTLFGVVSRTIDALGQFGI